MLTNVLLALVLSAAIALATGPKLIEWLRGHQMKTSENELGPKEHLKKRGTPIMGGLMIALGCIVSFVLCAAYTGAWVTTILPLLFVSLGSMAVGLADDWTKAVKHRSEGLTPWQKIIGLSVVCLGFSVWCYFTQGSKVLLPFANTEWDLGLWYIPLLALTVLFMTNSANLQDGIDGILSSVTSVGCMGWAVIAGLSAVTVYQHLNGGSFGIRFTCCMSSVSVILQRYYYKATRKIYGTPRRLFKMSPLHHHFEKCGMKETQIVLMYTVVTLVLTALAVISVIV